VEFGWEVFSGRPMAAVHFVAVAGCSVSLTQTTVRLATRCGRSRGGIQNCE
jgi:hypothetical protein